MTQSDAEFAKAADPFSHGAAMKDTDRFKLLFGPYETPLFEYGQIVFCECRGEVEIIGITDAKIPWPLAKWGRRRSPVLYDCLADAVRRESNQAVAHW